MGCDLCVYIPKYGDEDCGMSYSTFNRVRASIIQLYLEKMGAVVEMDDKEAYAYSLGIISDSLHKKVSQALVDVGSSEAEGMLTLWTHSDCDGTYWTEECKTIASGIKKILTMFDEDDEDKGWAEALMQLFDAAGRNEGIVEVC